jgi:hypothetical protein
MSDIKIINTDHVKCLGLYCGVSEFCLLPPEEHELTFKKAVLGLEDASPSKKSSKKCFPNGSLRLGLSYTYSGRLSALACTNIYGTGKLCLRFNSAFQLLHLI